MDTILDLRETTSIYPADFVEACKMEFPEWVQLHDELDCQSLHVGSMLEDLNQRASAWLMNISGIEAAEHFPASQRAQALFNRWVEIFEAYEAVLAI